MKDRTDKIRSVVAQCPGVEFHLLRIEDAFDPSWWQRLGFDQDIHALRVALGDDSKSTLPNDTLNPLMYHIIGLPYTFQSSQSSTEYPITTLRRYLASLPTPTALDSTVKTLTRVLLQYTAVSTGSSHLLLGTTLTSLAVSLISSVAHGGGFHLKEEIQEEWHPELSAAMDRTASVRIIRPLRDVGRKECAVWSWWMRLTVAGREEWRWPGTKPGVGRLTTGWYTFYFATACLS